MSIYGLAVFAAVYFVAVATPGPGVAALVARSLARGSRGSTFFIAGFIVGDLIWFTVAATGLAALAQTAYAVLVVVKYCGVAYLLFLAFRLWSTPARTVAEGDAARGEKRVQLFLGSLALTLSNPKAIVFFLALLPTVVKLESLTLTDFIKVASIIVVVLPLVMAGYVVVASRARRMFKSPNAMRRINRGTGVAMATAAVAVATR